MENDENSQERRWDDDNEAVAEFPSNSNASYIIPGGSGQALPVFQSHLAYHDQGFSYRLLQAPFQGNILQSAAHSTFGNSNEYGNSETEDGGSSSVQSAQILAPVPGYPVQFLPMHSTGLGPSSSNMRSGIVSSVSNPGSADQSTDQSNQQYVDNCSLHMSQPSVIPPSLFRVNEAQVGPSSTSSNQGRLHQVASSTLRANSLQGFVSQSDDPGPSEATPLSPQSPKDGAVSSINLVFGDRQAERAALQSSRVSRQGSIEIYSNEPDTTQGNGNSDDDVSRSPQYVHMEVSESAEAEGSEMPAVGSSRHNVTDILSAAINSTLDVAPVGRSQSSSAIHASSTMANNVDTTSLDTSNNNLDSSLPGSSGIMAAMSAMVNIHSNTPGLDGEVSGNIDTTVMTDDESDSEVDDIDVTINGHNEGAHADKLDESGSVMDEKPDLSALGHIRRSHRISILEQGQTLPTKPRYISKPFNKDELWCEECMCSYPSDCPEHPVQVINDKVVLSRAWSSLPSNLQIFRIVQSVNELGVFAKKIIPKLSQFGPYVSPLVDSKDAITHGSFMLQLDQDDGTSKYFNPDDENKCNWMMFVRPATNYAEQNLVAFQYGTDIYFSVTREIEPRQELKVWYAAQYAEHVGQVTHYISEQDMEEIDNQSKKWSCYECDKKFPSQGLLQKHLIVHDESAENNNDDENYNVQEDILLSKMRRNPPLFTTRTTSLHRRKRRGRPPKKAKEDELTAIQAWKKKKATMYLNKMKKMKTNDSRKRTIKTYLYKRKGKLTGGNEWVCTHCFLTFDNPSLLNLHTLTHAAEDVGFDEARKAAGENQETDVQTDSTETLLMCPVCHLLFSTTRDLIEHAGSHAKIRPHNKAYKCPQCWRSFRSDDRLESHMLVHGDEQSKPLECEHCLKRFMNNSALSCHLKKHKDEKYYECPICHDRFDKLQELKSHSNVHCSNGIYSCPECFCQFIDYNLIRKHMRNYHAVKKYNCTFCEKVFPRPDKLKLHMLCHSTHREFMCDTCGRQFKRKDKLKEHIKRMHSLDRDGKRRMNKPTTPVKKFIPKVQPTDYHRFIYKCHTCQLGFKRRGMLVNHLAKRHPEVKPESVPELNLPILRTQRDYYCQYCEKVYKSSSKRKTHILKNHPGAELPMTSRDAEGKKRLSTSAENQEEGVNIELQPEYSQTFSQTVGSVTTVPHPCEFCHKQYASRAKLLQHQRKKHPNLVPPVRTPVRPLFPDVHTVQQTNQPTDMERFETDASQNTIPVMLIPNENIQSADLLTQAMSELTQSLSDYRQTGNVDYVPRVSQTAAQHPHSTIELSHLGQIAHASFPPQAHTTQNVNPHVIQISTTQNTQGIPMNVTYITNPRTWTSTSGNFQSGGFR